MRILTRHYVTRYLGFYFAILIGATLMISMVEAMLRYDELFGAEAGTRSALEAMLLRIPSYYLPDLIPIAAFAAGFLTLGLSARALELTAVAAGGVPLRRLTVPILVAAAGLAVGSYVLQEQLINRATEGWNAQERDRDERLIFHRGAFWYHKGHRLFNISGSDPETSTLRGVEVFERAPGGRLESIIHAQRVRVDDQGVWHFDDASVRRFDPQRPETPTRFERGVQIDLEVDKDRGLLLRQADVATLPLPDLHDYLSEQDADPSPSERVRLQQLETQFHRRSSAPFLIVVFTLLAIPIAVRVTPGGSLAAGAVLSVATIAGLLALRSLGANLGEVGILPPAVAIWSVIGVFGALGLAGLSRRVIRGPY